MAVPLDRVGGGGAVKTKLMFPEQGGNGEKDQSTVVHSFISPSLPFLTCKVELIIVFLPQEVLRINETTQVKSKPRVHRGSREVWGVGGMLDVLVVMMSRR